MASDNASVMIGSKNSFLILLKVDVLQVIQLNCICHSAILVANKVSEKLSRSCENLFKDITTYMFGSAKRSTILREFQNFFEVKCWD